MTFDHALLFATASRQHGLVTRADLDRLGVIRGERRGLESRSALVRLGPQVYRLGGTVDSPRQRVAAACLDAVGTATHETAAWLHGLPGFGPGRPPEVLVPGTAARYRGTLARVHSTTWLPEYDVVDVHGISCLGVARTLFSLAGSRISTRRLHNAVDDAVRLGLASDAWLWWRLERLRHRGRRGVAGFEAALQVRAGGARTEGWLERELLRLLHVAGLPLPVCQHRIGRKGAFVARVDFAYLEERIAIEVLGHVVHSSRAQLMDDAARRNRLQLAGYQVLEFTYDDVVSRPDHVVSVVRAALIARQRPTSPRSGSARTRTR